jgi:hypothetical protein
MRPVYSSHVTAVGHDPEKQELHVQWDTGKTSIYAGVPASLAEQVRTSASVGQALRDRVKGKYDHRYG